MNRSFGGKTTASAIIKQGLLQGKNSVQIFLMVKQVFPNYNDHKLRKLISVVKSKHILK